MGRSARAALAPASTRGVRVPRLRGMCARNRRAANRAVEVRAALETDRGAAPPQPAEQVAAQLRRRVRALERQHPCKRSSERVAVAAHREALAVGGLVAQPLGVDLVRHGTLDRRARPARPPRAMIPSGHPALAASATAGPRAPPCEGARMGRPASEVERQASRPYYEWAMWGMRAFPGRTPHGQGSPRSTMGWRAASSARAGGTAARSWPRGSARADPSRVRIPARQGRHPS